MPSSGFQVMSPLMAMAITISGEARKAFVLLLPSLRCFSSIYRSSVGSMITCWNISSETDVNPTVNEYLEARRKLRFKASEYDGRSSGLPVWNE